MDLPKLIADLNGHNFRAFPQNKRDGEFIEKGENVKRCTLIVSGEDGKDFFLSRASVGVNEDGTAKYQWVRGVQLKAQDKTATSEQDD